MLGCSGSQAGHPYLTFPAQADNLMLRQPLLLLGSDRLRGEEYLRAGVRVLEAEGGSLRLEVAISGLLQDQQVADAKVVHVMIDLALVRTRQAEHINLLREEISGKKLINQIKYITNSKVQGAVHMVMHANFSMPDNQRRSSQQQRPVLHLLLVNIPLILSRSNGEFRIRPMVALMIEIGIFLPEDRQKHC